MKYVLNCILLLFFSLATHFISIAGGPEIGLSRKPSERDFRPKPISYNCIGYSHVLNEKELILGGTSAVFKRFGSFLAYKIGIKNYSLPNGEKGDLLKEHVIDNGGSFTNRTDRAVTFMLSTGITFAIWKKMPMYIGAGFTRYRYFFEYLDPWDNFKPKWNRDDDLTGFYMNYTAGFILPLGRFLLNVGYDHQPQSIFIGIGLSGKNVYKNIDEWK